ncbi:RagB/SusD family nutrient uptake outer membrane protein [Maribacter polysiphoniae]|uniref:Putative outer membrane starch-binding protein n=1 Tax=Maribacter polysiphoniae TaxID=429344 RepID=A0A316DVC5_9FLAO|nr:RagB/SusD family nutrient uptake outer membrane protein [Maribacter polysiphoniae]MBD1263016.1 RagB/SusD family nutrient uptake outer membrane protein [Maribacter polysiphoniae]PWK22051.1 putative outer membrane starch-binding protein [Maribacter polysiphoniae]
MKNIKNSISLIIILTTLVGCSDVVEFDPHDEYEVTEVDYLQTQSDYETMAVSCYTPTQWLNQLVVIGDIASDNAVAGGENASDVVALQQIDDHAILTNNSTLEDLWKSAYEGVNRTNYLISYKDVNLLGETVEFDGKEALYGEVYFLRAYYYFNLVKMFGDVVLFTDHKLGLSDFGTLQRSPKEDVYAQIEIDLLDAISVLPTTQSQQGRITKYAAQALLGKVYLYQEKFSEAAAMLENVVNGPFSLVSNFDDIFLLEGENGPESVYEVQYSNGQPYYNWSGQTRGQGNYAVQQCGVRGLNGTAEMPYNSGWSTNLPTQDLAAAYENGDQRKNATVFDVEAYANDNPGLNVTYQVAPYKNTDLYNKKYLPRKGQTSGQVELNYENNHRIIRYSEVLLMAAEANLRSATPNVPKAQGYLDQVRDRAFGDTDHRVTATVDAIWNERRLELAMEGDRFFDLVRTGQAASVLGSGYNSATNGLFPIPQNEIEISNLTQNDGY